MNDKQTTHAAEAHFDELGRKAEAHLEAIGMKHGNGPRPGSATEMSLEWVMAKMDAIFHDNVHIAESLKILQRPMDERGMHSQAIAEVIQAREATNREALKFLEKIYDGLKPVPTVIDTGSILKGLDLTGLSENLESQHVVDIVKAIAGSLANV